MNTKEPGIEKALITLALSFFALWLSGFVFLKGWNWFVVLATDFTTITYPVAFALSMLPSRADINEIRAYQKRSLDSREVLSMITGSLLKLLILWTLHTMVS